MVTTGTRPAQGPGGFSRYVLLGGLLVAAVVVGLLGMHTLSHHGTAFAQTPAAVSASAGDAGAAHHGEATTTASGDHGPACADCGGGEHLGMAMACVLALLLVLIVLLPPRLLPRWMHTVPLPVLVTRFVDRVLPRAPSLHVLCISRT